jgi:hypothetical protein
MLGNPWVSPDWPAESESGSGSVFAITVSFLVFFMRCLEARGVPIERNL